MGIFIGLTFDPTGVKKSAWQKAYSESLQLLNAYEFCNIVHDTETFPGCKWVYAKRASECELHDGLIGWRVCGDLPTLGNAESFFLHKDLNYYRKGYKKAPKSGADIYSQFVCENHICNTKIKHIKLRATRIFHEKTQGYPYHLYILAIAILIENRFPRKAAVFGDVTRGQMRKAIEWANTVLTDKLQLPDRCCDKKLLKRLKPDFNDEGTRLNAFFKLSLNDYNKELGTLLRNEFSNEGIKSYFKEDLKSNRPGTIGYNDKLRQFLKLGLDLDMLCEICVIDDDGLQMSPAEFMRYFIELEFHVEEDELHQEMHALARQHHRCAEDTEPQTIPSAITGSLMRMSGLNPAAKPFVALEVIREVFMRRFSAQCDVLSLVKDCVNKKEVEPDELAKEDKDPMDDMLDSIIAKIEENRHGRKNQDNDQSDDNSSADICDLTDLIIWKPGQTFSAHVQKGLDVLRKSVISASEKHQSEIEKFFVDEPRKQTLIELNRYFIIRESTWAFIFDNCDDLEFYKIFVALLLIEADEMTANILCKNVLNNIELFQYLFSLKPKSKH